MNGNKWIHEYMLRNNVPARDAIDAYKRFVLWPKQCKVFRRQLGRWS